MTRLRRGSLGGLWLTAVLLLAACAGQQPAPDVAPLTLDLWRLEGRLALSNGRDGGSGTLSWSHQQGLSQMAFVGAFGRGGWRLTVTPLSAELVLSDGQVRVAPEVGDLVAELTGWQIPVQALTFWVTGRAQPGFPVTAERHDRGYVKSLRQHGWQVQFDGRLAAGSGTLPRKITATRGNDRVRLLVKDWTVAAGAVGTADQG